MTVIAYRDGVMAADSCDSDSSLYVGSVKKIVRSFDGVVGASSGRSGTAHRFRDWMETGRLDGRLDTFVAHEEAGDFAALIVLPGRLKHAKDLRFLVYRMDHRGYVYPAAEAEFYAEGYGREVALGAMAAGASAYDAAMIATRLSPYCLQPIQVETVA